MKKTVYLKRIIFIILAAVMISGTCAILERKTVVGEWNYSLKVGGFKNEPENSFDIIGFGSSHMYCTLNPLSIYDEFGLRSYVLATQQQPVEATYYYIKEALETQNPEVIVLEALMFAVQGDTVTEGVAHDAVDPFPNGINKIRMIQALNTDDSKENYYFNIMKYHTRWKELSGADFIFSWKSETDPTHGYVFLTGVQPNGVYQVSYENVTATPIKESNEKTFLDIVELVNNSDSELLLLVAPYNVSGDVLGYYKYLHELAEKNDVKVLDMNLEFDSVGISNDTDFYDGGHLNVYGAEKASSYIVDFIKENYDIEANDVDDEELWEADLKYYNERLGR